MLGLFIALLLFVFSVFRIFIIETLITRVIIIFQALGNFLQASKMTGLCSFVSFYSDSFVIRRKGESQNNRYKQENKARKIFQNLAGVRMLLFLKFCVPSFLVTIVFLRFAFLPYYQQIKAGVSKIILVQFLGIMRKTYYKGTPHFYCFFIICLLVYFLNIA